MLIDKTGNTTIITQEKLSIIELVKKITAGYEKFSNDNIIVNLVSLDTIDTNDISDFLVVSNKHRAAKHSFAIVSSKVNLDLVPEELIIVPSLQEAHDLIEMEEMERDLGF